MIENMALFNVEVHELTDAERKAFADQARTMHAEYAAGIEGGPELLKTINDALSAMR